MDEEKNVSFEGQSSKKSASSQKPTAKKSQKERPKAEVQTPPATDTDPVLLINKKIDDVVRDIEKNPLKSFEKKGRERLVQSYEKLIFRMIREINNSRR